jgi:ribosomal protein L30
MLSTDVKIDRIRQVGSPIRRDRKQALHLKSLGLRGIGSERELVVNSTVLGLLRKTRHLVIEVSSRTQPAEVKTSSGSEAGRIEVSGEQGVSL